MQITLLGTGSSDGWPNAFCRCPSCGDARRRGDLRSPTSVLIDGRLLLDCGPETERQAQRHGFDLADVQAIVVTHAHNDHWSPAALMYRSWVRSEPLTVVGPEPVIEAGQHWLDPQQQSVSFRTVTRGDEIEVAGYRITVLPANHHALGEAVLYLVQDETARVLYATDTGPLTADFADRVGNSPVDLVLLEETFGHRSDPGETHLNLVSFAETIQQLRTGGVVTDHTQVVAIHMSHHNPPLGQLQTLLAGIGAEVHPDGWTNSVSRPRRP